MTAIKGEIHSSKDHAKNLGGPCVGIQAATLYEQWNQAALHTPGDFSLHDPVPAGNLRQALKYCTHL